jgi:hypothetical protein
MNILHLRAHNKASNFKFTVTAVAQGYLDKQASI